MLIGAAAQRLSPQLRGMASGAINAGGSFGQFVFAPLLQRLISGFGWVGAMFSLALISLAALPFARALRGRASPDEAATHHLESPAHNMDKGLRVALRHAIADRSYLLLHAGFFTCGFHIAFLVTHLPGEVQLCGLPAQVASWSLALIGLSNIAGSLAAGWAVQRYRSKYVLAWMYGSRALLVALYLMAPKTAMTFYIFAVGLGLTWLATVPPTAGVVGKLFGTRYLGTLFGLTLLSHQIGGFLGAWLGGIAIIQTGDYNWMWYADMALAAAAALCNLPIREAQVRRRSSPPERGEFAFARATPLAAVERCPRRGRSEIRQSGARADRQADATSAGTRPHARQATRLRCPAGRRRPFQVLPRSVRNSLVPRITRSTLAGRAAAAWSVGAHLPLMLEHAACAREAARSIRNASMRARRRCNALPGGRRFSASLRGEIPGTLAPL